MSDVICLKSEAFEVLLDRVVEHINQKFNLPNQFKWITPETAEALLNTKRAKLQELRDTGQIRYSQPTAKHILYDVDSIQAYLEKHARETF
jgi:hypothetical protein